MQQATTEFINELLTYTDEDYLDDDDNRWAFFIHASIELRSIEHMMQTYFVHSEWKIFDYELQIGKKLYEMRLVFVTFKYRNEIEKLHKLLQLSQFSFPWSDNPTVFIDQDSFHILKRFIKNNRLDKNILKLEEKPGITANDEIIKVVTFNKNSNDSDIIENYWKYLKPIDTKRRQYYFMARAFPWLQPNLVEHLNMPLDDEFYPIFYIILKHLGTLKNNFKLNMFDLLALRYGLCDFRNPFPSSLVNYEIDFLIKRELVKIIKNKHLDIDQYMITENVEQRDLLISYLIYEFQNYFETVNTTTHLLYSNNLSGTKIRGTIKLADEHDILVKLKEKCNINIQVDGQGYDTMNLSLFLDIFDVDTVTTIRLDTDYRWLQNECNLNRSTSNSKGGFKLELFGNNTYNFIEDFLSSFKTVTFSNTKKFYIRIHSSVNDFTAFDNLKAYEVNFIDFKIDNNMLIALNKCNLNLISVIKLINCSFENSYDNWELLFKIEKISSIDICEEEHTLQTLFDFILSQMHTKKLNYFRFREIPFRIKNCDRDIRLDEVEFAIDNETSKLEMFNSVNKQSVDLFYLKFQLTNLDDKSEYDFYD